MNEDLSTLHSIHVVAGVIENTQGEILLTRRPDHVHQGGLWEFPGGKCEQGESIEQALVRELKEELDIDVQQARPLIRIDHTYPDQRRVLLDVWRVEHWAGQPWGREQQRMEWCAMKALQDRAFPSANLPILSALRLPSFYLITPEPSSWRDKKFFYQLEACLDQQISLIQLRAKHLTDKEYCYYAEKALTLCDRHGATLMVNTTVEIALSVGASGLHLTCERAQCYTERPLEKSWNISTSCHSLAEIQHAHRLQVDFIVLSPVKMTPSHIETPPLGWHQFFHLTEQSDCPVFALGGMNKQDVVKAWAHGGQGIAAIRSLWGN